VRSRIDWQYVLRLALTDPGFDASVLSAFRTRLITGAAEFLRFDTWLTWGRARQLVRARGRQRPDSTHILAAVRALNRIEVVGETLRHALNALAAAAPAWLHAVSHPDWRDRYTRRAADHRLPTTRAARAALALTIGPDEWQLRAVVDHPEAPLWLHEVPAVAILRRVWIQNYWCSGGAYGPASISWTPASLDADLLVRSQERYGVDLLGPTCLDDHWQARAGAGFDAQHFQVDWNRLQAICPAGETSIRVRSQKRYPRRTLTLRPQPP